MSAAIGVVAWAIAQVAGLELGAELAEVEREVYVVRVIPGGRAERSGLLPGQRLLAIDGQGIESLADVEFALQTRGDGRGLSLQVDDQGGGIGRPRARLGLRGTGLPITGDPQVLAAWLGLHLDLRLAGGSWFGLGVGYVPLGRQASVDGVNLVMPQLTLEYELHLWSALWGFGRGLVGANLVVNGSDRYPIKPVTAGLQVGLRAWMIEFHLHLSVGPGEGLNLGGGLGFAFDLVAPTRRNAVY